MRNQPLSVFRYLLSAVTLLALSTPARAATFNVAPVRIELDAQTRTAALTLNNPSDEPVVVKVEMVAWSQVGGQDVYVPTTDVLAVPPLFTLAPNSSQVVRLALRRTADPARELTYRVYLSQQPGKQTDSGVNVKVLLRVGVPIFVTAANAAPKVEWSVQGNDDGTLTLTARNTGTAHIQVTELRLSAGTEVISDLDSSAYILAGQTRSFTLKVARPVTAGAILRLEGDSDNGPLNATLSLGR